MSVRDETSSVEDEGDDLQDTKLWNEDLNEADVEDGYEMDSRMADEDASTSEGERSLDTIGHLELEHRLQQRKRRAAEGQGKAEKKMKLDGLKPRALRNLLDDMSDVSSIITEEPSEMSDYTRSRAAASVASKQSSWAGKSTAAGRTHGKRGGASSAPGDDSSSDSEEYQPLNLEDLKGIPSTWMMQEPARREVKHRFRSFLREYKGQNHGSGEGKDLPVYIQRIHQLVTFQQQSLVVYFQNLAAYNVGLAVCAGEAPTITLKLFDEVATRETFRLFPNYQHIVPKIHVRLIDLPVCDAIRNLRCLHMNMLTMVHGVVTRRSQVYPQMQEVKFDCLSCSYTIGPLAQRGNQEAKVRQCPSCQRPGPFRLNSSQTVYRNYQTIILQESPGTVPPGRLPRWIEVILLHDLVDIARPGDEIQVTGIYRNNFDPLLNHRQGFPVFTTVLEANAIRKKADDVKEALTDEELAELRALARHPNIVEKIVNSIAPSIHGHEITKAGIACSLFGGVAKEIGDTNKHHIRGDINVLLLGDPGTAKSQFLKYVEKTSPRSVFTTGRGSTAVGLTAAVHRDSMTGEWTLEGGALVIADKGHCLIDEFDKMSDQDRTSIHEAMEQQTISIAKAGIVTSLQARCAIIAAANPVMGHYDSTQTFESQVNLTQPILSRFDLLFAIRDTVDAVKDTELATFVVNSHIKNHPRSKGLTPALMGTSPEKVEDTDPASPNPLPQKLLQKYILYARTHCEPRMEKVDIDKLVSFYVKLRVDSALKYESGVKVVVRHLESICRLATAFAKIRLSSYVRDDDVNRAIALFLNCFLGTLQYKLREQLKRKYSQYLVLEKQHSQVLHHLLSALVKEQCQLLALKYGGYEDREIVVQYEDLQNAASEHRIFERDIAVFLQSELFTSSFAIIEDHSGAPSSFLWLRGGKGALRNGGPEENAPFHSAQDVIIP